MTKVADMFLGKEARHVKALGDTISILSNEQDKLAERVSAAEEKLDECEAKHADCEARVRGVSEELIDAKVKIAQLMAGAPATYQPSDLRRVRTKKPPG